VATNDDGDQSARSGLTVDEDCQQTVPEAEKLSRDGDKWCMVYGVDFVADDKT